MTVQVAVHSPDWDSHAVPGAPVMLLLHGYGSNEHDLPGLAPYLPPDVAWASTRAPVPMPGGGASWFPFTPGESPDDEDVLVAIGQLWDWIDAHVDPTSPLIPVGFSQGGLMAVELLRTRPERIAATVVLAGLMGKTQHAADALLAQSRPRVFWGRGAADTVIWPAAISRTEQFLSVHTDVTARVYPGLGHSVNEQMLTDVRKFLTPVLAELDPDS